MRVKRRSVRLQIWGRYEYLAVSGIEPKCVWRTENQNNCSSPYEGVTMYMEYEKFYAKIETHDRVGDQRDTPPH